jgi:hypothetical protein
MRNRRVLSILWHTRAMTQEEQDAIVGRTLREYNECRKELAAMEAKLAGVGDELLSLGKELKANPERVFFFGRGRDIRFGGMNRDAKSFTPASIDGNSIADQVTALQNLHVKRDELSQRLKSLGHETH